MAPQRDVIVMGASAGGVPLLRRVLRQLPANLDAAVAVAIHRSLNIRSTLADVFGNGAHLPVIEPCNGQRFEKGKVYLAPADVHMSLGQGCIHLERGPRQHHTRPAIDPLFESAARAYGPRAVGVILSGMLSDGVTGLIEIKHHGGLSLVQDPDEAACPSMPLNALAYDDVDLIFEVDVLCSILVELAAGATPAAAALSTGGRARQPPIALAPDWVTRAARSGVLSGQTRRMHGIARQRRA